MASHCTGHCKYLALLDWTAAEIKQRNDRIEELEADNVRLREALANPTPEMIRAGGSCKPWMAGWPKGEPTAADVWKAMAEKMLQLKEESNE